MPLGRRSVTFEVVQAHALGGLGDLTSSVLDLLDTQVAAVRVDSNVGPVTIPEPFHRTSGGSSAPAPSSSTAWTLPGTNVKLPTVESLLQPQYTFIDRSGGETTISPFGAPTHDYRPVILIGAAVVLGLAAWGARDLYKRGRRK